MSTSAPTRTSRVEARIAPDALALVRRAAELQGRSISDFLVSAALKDAPRTIEDVHLIRLSADDQRRFVELLLKPPPLAPAMKRALKARQASRCRRLVAARFRIEFLSLDHSRDGFSCGVEALDSYFVRQVSQDVRRHVCACYVAMEISSSKVAGYYTLAADGVLLSDLPVHLAKRLPRYPSAPVARVGRLAVDQSFRSEGLGGALLADAAL